MPRLTKIIWTPNALLLLDIKRLYDFLKRKDTFAAKNAIKAIRAGVKILQHQPQVGKPVEELDIEYREWFIGFGNSGYILIYRYEQNLVAILAIRHQKELEY
jgi:plasmid stabilization system protein ParE